MSAASTTITALLGIFLFALATGQVSAATDGPTQKELIFAVGVTHTSPDPTATTLLQESIDLFPEIDFRVMPLERSYRQFAGGQADCTIADLTWVQDHTLVGPVFFNVDYGLYRLPGKKGKPLDEAIVGKLLISTTATWIEEKLPKATILVGPTIENLATLLISGRVDYVLAANVGFGRLDLVANSTIVLDNSFGIVYRDPSHVMCSQGPAQEAFLSRFAAEIPGWRTRGLLPPE